MKTDIWRLRVRNSGCAGSRTCWIYELVRAESLKTPQIGECNQIDFRKSNGDDMPDAHERAGQLRTQMDMSTRE